MSPQTVRKGHEVLMDRIPSCDLTGCKRAAEYDSRLPKLGGGWGYVCGPHFREYGPGATGVGSAQRLIKRQS